MTERRKGAPSGATSRQPGGARSKGTPSGATSRQPGGARSPRSLLEPAILRTALIDSLRKLSPRAMLRNPVMFVVEVGAVLTTFVWLVQAFGGSIAGAGNDPAWYTFVVTIWLWLTVIFGNFAEAIAEGRGRAQAATLRSMRSETLARMQDGSTKAADALVVGDVVVVPAGEAIPGDGTVIRGIASVDESAITGESAPVIREAGGDRSAVTGGTRVLSDQIVVQITQKPGESFLDRMIALVEGAERRKTPNEVALGILLAGLTLIFLVVIVTLRPFANYAGTATSLATLISLLVALIPTTIGALLSAIGIAGMDRLVRRNVLALSGRAVEASGDVDVLLLDKTGTITLGNRQASEFVPMPGVTERELAEAAQLSSLADETPEGRSIVVLAKDKLGIRGRELAEHEARFVPFTAQTRMSGVDMNGTRLRKGAGDAIERWIAAEGGTAPAELRIAMDRIARDGGTPLAVARDNQALGVVHLQDIVKEGMRER
ncbi:MAG TPA: potassium-transporting ATPase subunit KdpB, partial [Conexibacter sp.]